MAPSVPRGAALGLACLLVATTGGACSSRRPARPHVAPPLEADSSPRRGVRGLPDLGRVDDGLWRSAQPTKEGYETARELGIRTVVDLRGSKEGRTRAARAGLEHVAVRTSARRMDEDDLVAFLRVAMDPARRPVLVHCASGHDRTGAAIAAYRRVVTGWSADQALREMRRFGAAPWYGNLEDLIRDLDPETMRARATAPPAPAPEPAASPPPAVTPAR